MSATPLRLGVGEDSTDLPYALLLEFVRRSDRFDSIEHLSVGGMEFSAARGLLEADQLDIAWNATSAEAEASLQPIYFPIYGGLLGFRIAIVEQDKADVLRGVTSTDQLRELWACQGKLWPDTQILEANGLTVAKSLKYPNLFAMLEADRCEYFPRGVFEPWQEIETHQALSLTVDPHLLIQYPLAFLFYARAGNTELADHLYSILLEMVEDGTYQTMFLADPAVKGALTKANLDQRQVLRFTNPLLTEAVQAIPARLWYDPFTRDD